MAAHAKPRIAVVGGGLGGSVVAILLQRAGYDVVVYEQAPALERVGAGIFLSPNATVVLRGADLEEPLLRAGALPEQFVHRDGQTGTVTYDLRYDEFQARYGARQVIMHRGDLQAVLTSGLAPGSLHLGKRLIGFDGNGPAVRLSFAGGTHADADIVIGADGINSRVRDILLGPEQPTFTGQIAHRSIFPAERIGHRVADATKWWADDRYIMDYYLTPDRDELYFVTIVPAEWKSDSFAPTPATLHDLERAFDGFHAEVQSVLRASSSTMAWPLLNRDPHQVWSSGRVVLLGDACHPMKPHMGQGAAMALEDAAVLARCIDHYNGEDVASAFRLYEALRFERTTRVKLESDRNVWMRYGSDCDWVFGYNAMNVPLRPPVPKHDAPLQ